MFIFYDLETSDLKRDFSQIFQIGLIATDDDFNIEDSRDLKCKRDPWIVPSPGALLTTGFTKDDLENAEKSQFDLIRETDEWVRSKDWPVVFIGYNSLGFDEDFFRHCLHQTLHDPFLTSGRKDWNDEPNGRADVLNLVKMTHVYMPGTLKLDIKTPSGVGPSLQLGNVARQNGVDLSEEDAHDALNDVKGTIGVAQLIKKAAPDLYDQWMSLATKKGVDDFLASNDVFAYTDYPYGAPHNYMATSVTSNPQMANEEILFDLSHDPAELMDKSVEELSEYFKVQGDDRFKQPLQSIRKNNQPILMPLDQADAVRPAGLDDETLKARAKMIADNWEFRVRVGKAAALARGEFTPGKEIEQQIYNFPDRAVRKRLDAWLAEFRDCDDWDRRVEMIGEFSKNFAEDVKKDPSLSRHLKFAQRLVYANAPDKLPEEQREKFANALLTRLQSEDDKAPWMTLKRARASIDEIRKEKADGNPRWKEVTEADFKALGEFYDHIEKELSDRAKKPRNDNAPDARKPASKSNRANGPKR